MAEMNSFKYRTSRKTNECNYDDYYKYFHFATVLNISIIELLGLRESERVKELDLSIK